MASNGNNLVKDTIDKFTGLSTNNTVLIQSASTVFTERETGALVKGSLRIRGISTTKNTLNGFNFYNL
jgi:hypothetical protein